MLPIITCIVFTPRFFDAGGSATGMAFGLWKFLLHQFQKVHFLGAGLSQSNSKILPS